VAILKKGDPRYPQLAKEPLITSRQRGTPENRIWAKVIDWMLIHICFLALNYFFPKLAWIFLIAAWSWIDSLGRGQSPGKWLSGLHTIDVQRASVPRVYGGLVRNLPFVLLSLGVSSDSWLSRIALALALAGIAVETYFIFILRSGIRVGDVMGNTRVFDYRDEHTQFIEQFLKKREGT
jgi:hypothetical protein